jgi:DeoR/GlpR family transcriptional regulator of sugar metabolism
MIESAQRTIVVMHSSKFGRSAFAHIVRLDGVGVLITDQMPAAELRDALAAAEVEIVVAAGLFRLCGIGEEWYHRGGFRPP